jgi:hypothetical protein
MDGMDLRFELLDPITGEVISADDPDAICDALDRLRPQLDQLRAAEQQLRRALGDLTHQAQRTEHVIGRRWHATVEHAATTWDRGTLRRLWEEVPEARAFLRLEQVGVDRRAIDQLRRGTGPGVASFRDALLEAERPSEAAPLIRLRRRDDHV